MRLKTRRVDPSCGWARFSVSPVRRRAGFFLDLGHQTLRYVPESGPARVRTPLPPLAPLLERVDDTFWLPRVDDLAWHAEALSTLRARQVPRVVEAGPGEPVQIGKPRFEGQEVVVYPLTHELLEERSLPSAPAGATTVLPWVPGFTAREEVWGLALDWAVEAEVAALVPLIPDLDDSAKRELARRSVDDRQYSELFHGAREDVESALREVREEIRAKGLATVIERPLPLGPERLRRNRRVAAALLTAAEGARHLSEARREELSRAARWIENEQRDLLAIAADGNLKVLEWLPSEAHGLVRQVLEGGDEFRLAAFEKSYCSKTPM
ncbi:MAG: hypothetical protein AAF690_03595 [Acidobacteriota bacterium]